MEQERAKQITKELTPIATNLVNFINGLKPEERIDVKKTIIAMMNK